MMTQTTRPESGYQPITEYYSYGDSAVARLFDHTDAQIIRVLIPGTESFMTDNTLWSALELDDEVTPLDAEAFALRVSELGGSLSDIYPTSDVPDEPFTRLTLGTAPTVERDHTARLPWSVTTVGSVEHTASRHRVYQINRGAIKRLDSTARIIKSDTRADFARRLTQMVWLKTYPTNSATNDELPIYMGMLREKFSTKFFFDALEAMDSQRQARFKKLLVHLSKSAAKPQQTPALASLKPVSKH